MPFETVADVINNNHVLGLTALLKTIGERVEGNLVCDIVPDNFTVNKNMDKIKNLQYLCKDKKKICEIGVNACHSLLMMVLENPTAEYLLFDLKLHRYTEPCIEYIKTHFPSTKITVLYGDSTKTVSAYINDPTNLNELHSYDMCHIDGGHTHDVFSKDFANIKELSAGCVIFDDYNYGAIKSFIDAEIRSGSIVKVNDSKIINTPLHFVYRVKPSLSH